MITIDEFQALTNDFMTVNEQEAQELADKYNSIGVEGEQIVPAKFGDHWCVMLKGAFDFTQELGI